MRAIEVESAIWTFDAHERSGLKRAWQRARVVVPRWSRFSYTAAARRALEKPMSTHVSITPAEAADRLAIRELVEGYAYCADRRDARRL